MLEELEREKGIKFFQCIGDPPHSQAFKDGVKNKREQDVLDAQNQMRQEDCSRFTTEVNNDKVIVDTRVTQ